MTETAKSVLFVAAAAGSLFVAYTLSPSRDVQNLDDLVGVRLNQFEVDVAKRLKIVKFEQETASTREFEVAENDGLWSIPSKQNYPADAAKQMGEAATCLIDREVLRIAGKSANDHEALGVIDPGTSKLDSKAEGVGTRVTITDANGSALADMIVGKAVKDSEGQYYVRNADQDVVYVVNLDPDKLSTKFEDWIEDDLLKLNPMDIRRVNIKDYSAELQPVLTAAGIQMQVKWDRRGEMTLLYDQGESKWKSEKMQRLDPDSKELVDFEIEADKELNDESLGELRSGLDDLLLVDVERKPAGLSADLKAGSDFLKNQEAATSLIGRGFAPLSITPDAPPEILSTEGEIVCTLKDGVEYVLRFGNLQIGEAGKSAEADDETLGENAATEDAATADGASPNSDDGINRYLFVMARFNESIIERPALAELPELPELPAAEAEKEASAADAASKTDSDTAPESEPEAEAEAEGAAEEATEPEDSAATDASDSAAEAADQPDSEADTEVDTEANTEADDTEAEDTVADEEGDANADTKAGTKADDEADNEADNEAELARVIAERESIEKENQRQLNEYQEKIKTGKERVAELNVRFGDWYYVISNDVYKKIHLGLEDVITAKKSEAESAAPNPGAGFPGGALPGLPNLPVGGAN